MKDDNFAKDEPQKVPSAPPEDFDTAVPVVMAEPVSTKSLLDPKTIELLESTDTFFVQQQIRWAEAITQGCFEQKNRYHIYNKDTNEKVMVRIFFGRPNLFDLNKCFRI